jgi:hypothetical protein
MTHEQFDSTILRFLRQEPFQPFIVELTDGRRIPIVERKLAVNIGGATLWTNGALVEFRADEVKDIRLPAQEAIS